VDVVIQGLVEEFQKVHNLTELPPSEAFEAFAAYCVLNSFYEDEFNPDSFRMGGGNDLGMDAVGILVNSELLRDAADVRASIEAARRLEIQIVVIQAKTSPGFETRVISDLAENLSHIAGPGDLPYAGSADVVNFRDCLTAIYGNIAKLSGALPLLCIR
jgi:hypothetical protein